MLNSWICTHASIRVSTVETMSKPPAKSTTPANSGIPDVHLDRVTLGDGVGHLNFHHRRGLKLATTVVSECRSVRGGSGNGSGGRDYGYSRNRVRRTDTMPRVIGVWIQRWSMNSRTTPQQKKKYTTLQYCTVQYPP